MAALEQPKKPTGGAYGQFLAEKRPEFTKACAGQPVTAISKMAGEAFKKLNDAQKKPYQEKYDVAKAKFEKDMAAFIAAGGEKQKGVTALRAEKRKAKEGKKKKDPNAPKKPAGGAYGVFLAAKRPEFMKACAGQPITAVSKMAGEAWKKLSDTQKKPFQAEYAKKLEAYKTAIAEYKKNNPDAEEDGEEEDEEEEEEEKPQPKKARKAGA
jgi:ABC-type transporter MlaC component